MEEENKCYKSLSATYPSIYNLVCLNSSSTLNGNLIKPYCGSTVKRKETSEVCLSPAKSKISYQQCYSNFGISDES